MSPIEKPKPKPKMPYVIRRLAKSNLYSVRHRETGKIHAFGITLENAQRQVKLLEARDHGGLRYV